MFQMHLKRNMLKIRNSLYQTSKTYCAGNYEIIPKIPTVYNKGKSKSLTTQLSRETKRRKTLERDKENEVSSNKVIDLIGRLHVYRFKCSA